MNISKKIEEMRLQPEHIRMRYVWISVAVSMTLILAIWIFSFISLMQKDTLPSENKTSEGVSELKQQIQELKKTAPSLKEYSNVPLDTGRPSDATASSIDDDFQRSINKDLPTEQPPQLSDQYSSQTSQ